MENNVMVVCTIIGLAFTLLIALLGWAYQLGFLSNKIQRSEKDIAEINGKLVQNEKDLKGEMRDNFRLMFDKIDGLPCHNPGWKRGDC
jgi:hypothetical protein